MSYNFQTRSIPLYRVEIELDKALERVFASIDKNAEDYHKTKKVSLAKNTSLANLFFEEK